MVRKIKDKNKAKNKKMLARIEEQTKREENSVKNAASNTTKISLPKKRIHSDKVTWGIIFFSILMLGLILLANNFLEKNKASNYQNPTVNHSANTVSTDIENVTVDATGDVDIKKVETKEIKVEEKK